MNRRRIKKQVKRHLLKTRGFKRANDIRFLGCVNYPTMGVHGYYFNVMILGHKTPFGGTIAYNYNPKVGIK